MILDASALLALLTGDAAAQKLAATIAAARIAATSHAEVVGYFARSGMPAEAIDAMLGTLPLAVIPVEAALARRAGMLRALPAAAELPLEDRVCAALALDLRAPLITANRAWLERSVAELRVEVLGIPA